jgi:hypothetical protein
MPGRAVIPIPVLVARPSASSLGHGFLIFFEVGSIGSREVCAVNPKSLGPLTVPDSEALSLITDYQSIFPTTPSHYYPRLRSRLKICQLRLNLQRISLPSTLGTLYPR